MFKMSYASKNHFHLVFIAVINRILVLNGTSGLNYRFDSSLVCNGHTIGERKKGVACHDSSLQIKLKFLGFFDSLF